MKHLNCVVAMFDKHTQAEEAVKQLQKAGFEMKNLSIVGKGYHTEEKAVGYYNAGDRMLYWGEQGAFWGGFWSLLFGSAFFMIPGFGPLLVAGPMAAWIVAALECGSTRRRSCCWRIECPRSGSGQYRNS